MRKIIQGKVYDTETATELASNRYWDGNNFERHGRNTYLYVTPRGAFFQADTTLWQRERDTIEPLSREAAQQLYDSLPEQDESEYIKYFGPAEDADDNSGYNFQIRGIPVELHAKIKAAAEVSGKSMNAFILALIEIGMSSEVY
jgi:predicted HicB family RNase H-like nuclease